MSAEDDPGGGGEPSDDLAVPRLTRADRIALLLLVAVPLGIALVVLIAGYLPLPGDDLVQNLPLRELAGRMIRAGRLPAWNPLIWSGTPLLAGWNAGALFPGTFLFAVLPLAVAWFANYLIAPLLAATGMHLLLRRHRVGPLAALLGALIFTYTGFMSGQIVHIGLEQGTALLPWVLLSVNGLGAATGPRSRVANVALLGVALAGTVLAGDPRAVTSTAIIAGLYSLALLIRAGAGRLRLLGTLGAGALLGAALSAIQWLPGLAFLSYSQRSSAAYTFFGAGSLSGARLASQLLVPFVFGGNGNFGLPVYAGDFNLPEVTIGCGLVALTAALLYGFPLLASIRDWAVGRRHPDDGRHLLVLYVMGALGLVLTLGTTIPLGHLTIHLPLFGNERLQNRNAVIFDLPLAFLVAYLVEDLGETTSAVRGVIRSWRGLVVLLPSLACVALCVDAFIRPASFARRFQSPGLSHALGELRPYFIATIAFAVAVAAAILLAAHLHAKAARILVSAVILGDVAIYSLNASYNLTAQSVVAASTPLSQGLNAYTGPTGRFALYNPGFDSPGGSTDQLVELGATDANILHSDPSVQGYGSIVNGIYQDATSTHYFQNLAPSAIASSIADELDLRALATLPSYFAVPIPAHAPIPVITARGVAAPHPNVGLPPYFAGPWPVSSSAPAVFVLAAPRELRRATIVLLPASRQPAQLEVTASGPSGVTVHASVAVNDNEAFVDLGGVSANTLTISDPGAIPGTIGATVAVTSHPDQRLLLAGAMQGVLTPPRWRFGGTLGPFSIWRNTQTVGLAWLQPLHSTAADPALRVAGSVSVLSDLLGSPQQMRVKTTKAAVLVRSEGFSSGWSVQLQPAAGGPPTVLRVRRLGLVEAVTVPAGDWIVSWRYAPASLLSGLIASIAGTITLLAMLGWLVRRRLGYKHSMGKNGQYSAPEILEGSTAPLSSRARSEIVR